MSHYQNVEFRAVDRPLSEEQMEFARQQSTRAEISRRSLSCEYNFSEFRGDINGLLRNGFDVFLQDASYGDRELRWRLPNGLSPNAFGPSTSMENA